MRISSDNKLLFTAGMDGAIIMYEIKDPQIANPAIKYDLKPIEKFSKEILTDKAHMDDLLSQRETAENDNAAANES
jgi:hypothetical protein